MPVGLKIWLLEAAITEKARQQGSYGKYFSITKLSLKKAIQTRGVSRWDQNYVEGTEDGNGCIVCLSV